MAHDNEKYPDYPILRGLQKPLEFLGLQGRYITWAAITAGASILGFVLVYVVAGFLFGLLFAAITICSGLATILLKQHKGLHSKRSDRGVFVYANLWKL